MCCFEGEVVAPYEREANGMVGWLLAIGYRVASETIFLWRQVDLFTPSKLQARR